MIFKLIFGLLFLALNTSDAMSLSTMSDEVSLSVSTTEILDGLTTDLELRCSFTGRANPSLASVLSIQISHSITTDIPSFYFVASVNAIEGHAYNITHEVSEISGAINNGPPFLSVRVEDPSSQNAGVYKCDINGFDQEGKPIELTNVTMVTTSRYSMDTLHNEVNKMVSTVQDQETFLHTLLKRFNDMKTSMFDGPVNYSGHQYYIVKKRPYFIRSEAQAVCKFVGGHLAELDSHGEYVFLRDWILRARKDETYIYTGATDENQEGVWVNEHSSTAGPTFDWGASRPTHSTLHNCQCFTSDSRLYLADCQCSYRYTGSIQQNVNSITDGVNLTAISSAVISGFTSSIEIRCSIRGNANPSMSSVISIFILHSNKTDQPVFNYMASINALDGHVRNFTHEVSDVSGAVDNNGESFLSFSLKHPGSARAGVYKCEVNGFDQIGKPLTLTNTLTVTESRPTVSDLLKEMKRKMRSIAEYQRFIGKLKSRIEAVKDELFYPPLQYGGSQYYLIKMLAYSIVSEAQATCNLFGGYLFQVDTHEKYQFFADFIRRTDVFELTMTDATDEEQEGVWRSAHSSNSSPATDWTPGRPLSDMTRNCQCFERHFWWTLSDCFCVYNYDDRNLDMKIAGYICEIPN